MKHLKNWKIFESYEKNLESYTELVREICYELSDVGYDIKVDSRLEVPSWAKDEIKKGHRVLAKDRILDITISKIGWFTYDDVKDTCERLIEALGNSSNWSSGNILPMTLATGKDRPKVYHYWQSNADMGEPVFLTPNSPLIYARKTSGGAIPTKHYTGLSITPTKERCLKSEIILRFR
jgi:hypothetical protein